MSITRAQQAKQMLQDGGMLVKPSTDGKRPGYRFEKGPGQASRESRDNRDRGMGMGGKQRSAPARDTGGRDPMAQFSGGANTEGVTFMDQARKDVNPLGILTQLPGAVGIVSRVLTPNPFGFSRAGRPFDANRFPGGGDSQAMVDIPTWMRLGFSSEAEYLASLEQDEDKKEDEGLRLAFRAEGGPIGGEYDFESARQMYGLGKLVKKVTRTVKKIAKSPVGKAAILAATYKLGGGKMFGGEGFKFSNLPGLGFLKPASTSIGAQAAAVGLSPREFMMGIGGKTAAGTSGGLGIGALGAIAGVSALAGLLTADQEEEAQELSRGEGIDIEAARRSILARAQGNIASDRRATAFLAEGGRIGLRNGGDDDDADDQESSYDDGPLLIPDDADLSPDDFYGRKEREGIMKMASAPDPMDSLNDMAQMLFGKNLDQLTDEEYIELLDAARDGMSEGGTPRKEPVAKKVMPLLDMGGMEKDYRAEGGFVPIGRMEKADDVPARLSKNEFVFTADAVRNAGDGDVDKGAEVMYNMMKNLEAGGEVSEESQGLEGARKMFQTSQRLEEVL